MADIAMLVAEEYERRVKSSRKDGGADGGEININLIPGVSVISQKVKNLQIKQQNFEIVKRVFEPKSQIGVAASMGFFSA